MTWWESNAPWTSGWVNINPDLLQKKSVVAVSSHPDCIDVFALGTDGQVYTDWLRPAGYTDWGGPIPAHGWNGWHVINPGDPQKKQSVVAVSDSPWCIDLFAMGTDGQVYSDSWHWTDPWSGWHVINPGGPQKQSVVAVSDRPRHVDIFAMGPAGQVYEDTCTYVDNPPQPPQKTGGDGGTVSKQETSYVHLPWKPGSPMYVQSDPLFLSATSRVLTVGNKNKWGHRCDLLFPSTNYVLKDGGEAKPGQLGLPDMMSGKKITAIPGSPIDGQTGQWDIWVELTFIT